MCLIALLAGCGLASQQDYAGDAADTGGRVYTGPPVPSDANTASAAYDVSPNLQPLGGRCEDGDGDGFGTNCARGPDCDDFSASVTDQCYRCARPATDCACDTPGARRLCDVVTDSDLAGPDGTCHLGERVCQDGRWTRCTALDGRTRTITPPVSCGSSCNPDCRVTTVCPTSTGDLSGGSGVVLGSATLPGYCPTGTGGITLPGRSPGGADGGVPPGTCTGTCGGVCCAAGQQCYTYEDTAVYPSWCTTSSRVPPPPVRTSVCGRACAPGQTHCGIPPNDDCCEATEMCRFGVCRTPSGVCRTDADCPAGNFCDRGVNRCFPRTNSRCNCEGDSVQQGCLNSVLAQGGDVVNDIFRTTSGQDARTLRFARYLRGIETNPTGCPIGRSNASSDPQFPCSRCNPTICDAYACFGGPRDTATIARFADRLDWLWTQHLRVNDWGGAVRDGDSRYYYPWRGRIYDLGAPANRVALFPITDHTNDSCLEPFEYTVWLSDNPNATTIADPRNPDPNQWNQATLVRVFTQGWTRNPRAIGDPSDTNDLTSTAYGDAVADAMTTVWALPCGFSFRYASVSAGNNGNPTSSCAFHSFDDELDAIAGLTVEGNSLSIYHVLPYGTAAGPDGLSFNTRVRTADVYFLFDTTGSMGGELSNLQSSLLSGTFVPGCSGGIIGGIRCIIPDAWFGVGYFDDFPVSPYGGGPDQVYRNMLDITSDAASAQSAVNALSIHWGYDGPESHVPALWSVATGRGYPGYLSDRTGCPAGRFGYPCFRPGTIPIVMMFTDAMYHNGPADTYLYDDRVVFGAGGGGYTYPAAVAVSGNEDQASARAIPEASSFVATGSTLGMRDDRGSPCSFSSAPDAAFVLDLTTTRSFRLDTVGSTFDTILYVIRASDGAVMGCNDDYVGLQSQLDLTLGPGRYYVWVDGYGSSAGTYVLRYGVAAGGTAARTPRFADAVAELNRIGAKVIVVNSCGGQSWCTPDARNHAVALANQTSSIVSGGSPAVYDIPSTGTGLGSAVINAVNDLANYSRMDVTAVALDNPATPSVDERCFVRSPAGTAPGTVRLSDPALGESAPYAAGRCVDPPGSASGVPVTARQCLPGTSVNFRAEFLNNCVMATSTRQTFTFDIVVLGNGSYELGRVPVTIVIPEQAYPPSGTFTYDVDGMTACGPGSHVDWTQLQFLADTPSGTSIVIDVQTAATSAGLAAAPRVNLGTTPPATSPLDIGAALAAAGQPTRLPYLRVTFTLNSNASRDRAPTLSGYRVLFNCISGT